MRVEVAGGVKMAGESGGSLVILRLATPGSDAAAICDIREYFYPVATLLSEVLFVRQNGLFCPGKCESESADDAGVKVRGFEELGSPSASLPKQNEGFLYVAIGAACHLLLRLRRNVEGLGRERGSGPRLARAPRN